MFNEAGPAQTEEDYGEEQVVEEEYGEEEEGTAR